MLHGLIAVNIRVRERSREPFVRCPDVRHDSQECLRRERESLDGRRQKFFDDKAVDGWMKGIRQEGEAEDRELGELARQDCQVCWWFSILFCFVFFQIWLLFFGCCCCVML